MDECVRSASGSGGAAAENEKAKGLPRFGTHRRSSTRSRRSPRELVGRTNATGAARPGGSRPTLTSPVAASARIPFAADSLRNPVGDATYDETRKSAARSPIITVGQFVWPLGSVGMTEASATRRRSMPRTRNCVSTTADASDPMRQVPAGW